MTRKEDLENDRPFAEIADNKKPNYLGSRGTVESLLRLHISALMTDPIGMEASMTQEARIMRRANIVAKILIGEDSRYLSVRNWNQPGAIDRFAAKWLGSAEIDSKEILAHCFIKLLGEMVGLAAMVDAEGPTDDDIHWQVEDLIQTYTGVFLGIDLAQQSATMLVDEEGPDLTKEAEAEWRAEGLFVDPDPDEDDEFEDEEDADDFSEDEEDDYDDGDDDLEEESKLFTNAFCPTGAGGGVDATCSPGGSGGASSGKPLSAEAAKAVEHWWTGGHEDINGSLRAGKPHPAASGLIEAINSAAPLAEDTVFYRGMSLPASSRAAQNMKKGYSVSDDGFMAVTDRKDVADTFATWGSNDDQSYKVSIKVKAGTKMASIPSGIGEKLLPPGNRFIIDKVSKKGGVHYVEARYVSR